jgi:peptidoglycan/xylan/chitin deacetylase (PgdA/CDA1 family)
VACLAVVAHGLPGVTAIHGVRRRWFPGLSGVGRPDHVALTFDDGPDPASTPRFLDALDACGVRATFFLLGRMVERAPGLAREIADAGHEIGVHGWGHRSPLLTLSYHGELRRARDTIAEATGTAPAFFRPPNGVLSAGALLAAGRLGLRPVLWTADGRDWSADTDAESVAATIGTRLAGGGTVLLHDSDCTSAPGSWRSALGALPLVLGECERRGLRTGPLGDHHLPHHRGQFSLIARSDWRSDPIVAKTAVGS